MNLKDAIRILENIHRDALRGVIKLTGPKGATRAFEQEDALRIAIKTLQGLPDFGKLGRKGGLATKASHGPEYFRRIGKLGGRPKKAKPKE
jgi:hypothetical protein